MAKATRGKASKSTSAQVAQREAEMIYAQALRTGSHLLHQAVSIIEQFERAHNDPDTEALVGAVSLIKYASDDIDAVAGSIEKEASHV